MKCKTNIFSPIFVSIGISRPHPIISHAMKLHFLFLLAALWTMPACVPQKKFSTLENAHQQLLKQLAQKDSLSKTTSIEDPCSTLLSDYRKSLQTIEQLRATNLNLNQSYQEMLERYTATMQHNQEILNQSAYQQNALRDESDQLSGDLQAQLSRLQAMQQDLLVREQRLGAMEENFRRAILERNEQISMLENTLQARSVSIGQSPDVFSQSLKENIVNKELFVTETAGRIYITVSQDLLFAPGSAQIDAEGKKTLQAVAIALLQEPEMDVLIEGHTDNTGTEAQNWELSLHRAMSVCKELEFRGFPPYRMTVAGRGSYAPIAPNTTKEGQAQNRRTEIILVPRSLTSASMQRNER
jgi:chemotaxis protein MotB